MAEFFRRLDEAPPARSYAEARRQLADVLRSVEDEMTDIPYDPSSWRTDGRMYPPQDDRELDAGHSELRRFRSLAHNTVLGSNGSIQILEAPPPPRGWRSGRVLFEKAGHDGRHVRDL
jgi:hypothetical protein